VDGFSIERPKTLMDTGVADFRFVAGEATDWAAARRDISARKAARMAAEEQLSALAYLDCSSGSARLDCSSGLLIWITDLDGLTGVLNRRRFDDALEWP